MKEFVTRKVANIPPLTYTVVNHKGDILKQRMSRYEAQVYADYWTKIVCDAHVVPEPRFSVRPRQPR
jgi:hypothetical protein